MIFQCPNLKQRKCFVSMIVQAFTKLFEQDLNNNSFHQDNNEGYPIASSANFLCIIINQVFKVKSYLKHMNEYFSLVRQLMSINDLIPYYLLERGFLARLSSLIFFDFMSDEEYDEVKEQIFAIETDIALEYNEDITREPRRFKEADFTKPSLSDLTGYLRLLWELLRYTVTDSNKEFAYHKSHDNFEYSLTPLEAKIFSFDKEQISDLYDAIASDNKSARSLISKIIAYACYGSLEVSKCCLKYIQSELKDDKFSKRTPEYFKLIQTIVNLDDEFKDQRNDIIVTNLVTHLNIRVDYPFPLDHFLRFIRKVPF